MATTRQRRRRVVGRPGPVGDPRSVQVLAQLDRDQVRWLTHYVIDLLDADPAERDTLEPLTPPPGWTWERWRATMADLQGRRLLAQALGDNWTF